MSSQSLDTIMVQQNNEAVSLHSEEVVLTPVDPTTQPQPPGQGPTEGQNLEPTRSIEQSIDTNNPNPIKSKEQTCFFETGEVSFHGQAHDGSQDQPIVVQDSRPVQHINPKDVLVVSHPQYRQMGTAESDARKGTTKEQITELAGPTMTTSQHHHEKTPTHRTTPSTQVKKSKSSKSKTKSKTKLRFPQPCPQGCLIRGQNHYSSVDSFAHAEKTHRLELVRLIGQDATGAVISDYQKLKSQYDSIFAPSTKHPLPVESDVSTSYGTIRTMASSIYHVSDEDDQEVDELQLFNREAQRLFQMSLKRRMKIAESNGLVPKSGTQSRLQSYWQLAELQIRARLEKTTSAKEKHNFRYHMKQFEANHPDISQQDNSEIEEIDVTAPSKHTPSQERQKTTETTSVLAIDKITQLIKSITPKNLTSDQSRLIHRQLLRTAHQFEPTKPTKFSLFNVDQKILNKVNLEKTVKLIQQIRQTINPTNWSTRLKLTDTADLELDILDLPDEASLFEILQVEWFNQRLQKDGVILVTGLEPVPLVQVFDHTEWDSEPVCVHQNFFAANKRPHAAPKSVCTGANPVGTVKYISAEQRRMSSLDDLSLNEFWQVLHQVQQERTHLTPNSVDAGKDDYFFHYLFVATNKLEQQPLDRFGNPKEDTRDLLCETFPEEVPICGDTRLSDFEENKSGRDLQFSGDIIGVTSPQIIVGATGTMFPIHTEEAGLASINRIFEGEKLWLIVPPENKRAFLDMVADKLNNFTDGVYTRDLYYVPTGEDVYTFEMKVILARSNTALFLSPDWLHFGLNWSTSATHPVLAEAVNASDGDAKRHLVRARKYQTELRTAIRRSSTTVGVNFGMLAQAWANIFEINFSFFGLRSCILHTEHCNCVLTRTENDKFNFDQPYKAPNHHLCYLNLKDSLCFDVDDCAITRYEGNPLEAFKKTDVIHKTPNNSNMFTARNIENVEVEKKPTKRYEQSSRHTKLKAFETGKAETESSAGKQSPTLTTSQRKQEPMHKPQIHATSSSAENIAKPTKSKTKAKTKRLLEESPDEAPHQRKKIRPTAKTTSYTFFHQRNLHHKRLFVPIFQVRHPLPQPKTNTKLTRIRTYPFQKGYYLVSFEGWRLEMNCPWWQNR